MKGRISATVDKETLDFLDYIEKNSYCRNKSHAIELALKVLAEEVKRGKYRK